MVHPNPGPIPRLIFNFQNRPALQACFFILTIAFVELWCYNTFKIDLEGLFMFANYHTHTTRCNHAVGTDREYVESALQSGLQILGFADHAPFPDYAKVGMRPEALPGYVVSLAALREEFKNQLTLHIGLELEYDPKNFPRQLDFLKQNGVEYLILGQHILFGIGDDPGMHVPSDDEQYLDHHCGLQREAMDTGAITYLAHPDGFNFVGSKEVYDKHIRRLCRHANDLHIPL